MRRSERSDVLVICSDDSLLIELGPLLGDAYRVHAIDTPDRIGAQVDAARWIGIVDVDSLAGAHGVLSRLEAQHPRCPLIVITARPEGWVGSIACGAVIAAISRNQIAAGRLGEVLVAAEDRLSSPALDNLPTGDRSVIPGIRDRFEPGLRRRRSLWVSAAVLLLVLGVDGAWVYHHYAPALRGRSTAVAPSTALPSRRQPSAAPGAIAAGAAPKVKLASPSAPQPGHVLELLSAARIAFRDQRLLPPLLNGALNGDSALELYGQVLRQDPQDDEALEGVKRLLVVGGNRITTELASGQLEDAARLLDVFKSAGISSADLQQWASAISAAQPKWLAQRATQNIAAGEFKTADELIAEAAGSGADAATLKGLRNQEAAKKLDLQLSAMADQVHAAVEVGALLQPAMDNARTRLAVMRSIARNDPLTLQAQQAVQEALVQEGEQAIRAAHFDIAERDLNAAAELGRSTLITLARGHLQAARDAAARTVRVAAVIGPQAARTASRVPSLIGSAATTHPSPPQAFIAAQPTGPLPGNYPSGAKGQDGSVVVEFTLSANGKASNVTVVQSDRPGVFDREAISAVRHGRYSTSDLVNHQPARARIKLRFTPG
ncbi:MAG TPA: energy transducer TonB [Steroidobacteraceae bacterium]|nr:energy transducer TonB [Steroidobacteraceae bacterium]